MVSAREAAEGGLETVDRPGGGRQGTALADQVLKPRGAKPRKRTTSARARRNALPERTVSGGLDIHPARREVTARQRSECFAIVRKMRPLLPVRTVVDGQIIGGLEITMHADGVGVIIGCVSVKRWTSGLNLAAFPEDLVVEKCGDNGIIIRPLPETPEVPYVVTTAGTRA